MTEQYAIECRQITKAFGSVVANDKIDLTVRYNAHEHAFRYLPPRCRFDSGWRKRSLHKFAGRFEKFRNRYDSSAFQTGGCVQCDG